MEDFEIIRGFIAESEFSPVIRDALMQAVALEVQGKPQSEYLALVKRISSEHPNED